MSRIRESAVAGQFYPAAPAALHAQLADMLARAEAEGPAPKAFIAPHAGYVYSGPVAASAYARLRAAADRIRRVVLLGPSHRVAFRGLAASSADTFVTPLGAVSVDTDAVRQVLALPQVRILDEAHAAEHSLEVHLPFLQEVLTDFRLVPLVVGDAAPEDVAQVLDVLWGGEETLIVVSSDLSHYHDYATARDMDSRTSRAIEEGRLQDIGYDDACGRNPVKGLLYAAAARGLHAHTIDLRSSGDTAGPRDRVVGYGAYVFQ